MLYKGLETSPHQTCFKTLKGSPKEKVQREQYLLVVGLGPVPNAERAALCSFNIENMHPTDIATFLDQQVHQGRLYY